MNNAHQLSGSGWVVDIGFSHRDVSVPGYTVRVDLMKLPVERDIDLWITQYPSILDDGDEERTSENQADGKSALLGRRDDGTFREIQEHPTEELQAS
jgi:hypothetical protein